MRIPLWFDFGYAAFTDLTQRHGDAVHDDIRQMMMRNLDAHAVVRAEQLDVQKVATWLRRGDEGQLRDHAARFSLRSWRVSRSRNLRVSIAFRSERGLQRFTCASVSRYSWAIVFMPSSQILRSV
jgi:hypothetical protein